MRLDCEDDKIRAAGVGDAVRRQDARDDLFAVLLELEPALADRLQMLPRATTVTLSPAAASLAAMWPPIAPAPMTVMFIARSEPKLSKKLISRSFYHHNEPRGRVSKRRQEGALDYRKQFRVKPGEKVRLNKLDPSDTGKLNPRTTAKEDAEHYLKELGRQQVLLYAEHKHAVLIVLQAMDAGGKDGTIRHVFSGVNPQGVDVASFKQPTPLELAHDFLWRIHPQAPRAGQIVIFNRSHYEDVLVTRVHKLVDKKTCARRYEHICDFEALLAQSGTTILKFFLHISKEEQLDRFAQRLDDPARNWKISESDYSERELWDDYVDAYRGCDPRHQHR